MTAHTSQCAVLPAPKLKNTQMSGLQLADAAMRATCPATLHPSECDAALSGHDGACRCNHDNGDCKGKPTPPPTKTCSSLASCVDCLTTEGVSCGWCSSSAVCMEGSVGGPDSSATACPVGHWFVTQCYANPPRLSITLPAKDAALRAGSWYEVTWSGGASDSKIVFELDNPDTGVETGYGLPAGMPSTRVERTHCHASMWISTPVWPRRAGLHRLCLPASSQSVRGSTPGIAS